MNPKKLKGKRRDKEIQDRSGTRLSNFFRSENFDILIPVIIIFSLINPLRAVLSQFYILEYPDDIVWVSWASKHFDQPLSILLDKPGTGLRPMINFLYAAGYSLWGSNEAYYYLMNGVLFAGSMVFLYLLIKMLHGRLAGVIAVFLYLFLDASFILVWKMNYTTSIAEIFFITSSLFFSIHFFEKKDKGSMVLAFVLAIFAFLSKEPSMVIIPTVNILYLLHKWNSVGTRTRAAALLVNIFLPLLFLILTVSVSSEVNAPVTSSLYELVKSRLVSYMQLELSDTMGQLKNAYILFLACTGTFFFHKFKQEEYGGMQVNTIKNIFSVLIIGSVFISSEFWSLYSPAGAVLIIMLLVFGFLFADVSQRLGIAWFAVALTPLLVTSQQVQPTYLAEPNLGMSLFIGVTVSEYLRYIFSRKIFDVKNMTAFSQLFKVANMGIVVIILLMQLSAVPVELSNTNNYHNMVINNQKNFKEAVDYLKVSVPQNGTIYYISTEERLKIGGSQINSNSIQDILCLKGRCDIEIRSLSSLDVNSEKQNDGFVVLLSNLDVYIFNQEYQSLMKNDIYASQKEIKNGDSVAYILGLR